jgi:hypothetical protein
MVALGGFKVPDFLQHFCRRFKKPCHFQKADWRQKKPSHFQQGPINVHRVRSDLVE